MKKVKLIHLMILLALVALLGEGLVQAQDIETALQGLLNQEVKDQGILGMAMAVRLADGTVIGKASGYSDPLGEEAWSVDTVSAIASITKTYTAVVVMQLVEEGKFSLDDTIDTWFPQQPNGDKITVRMLLSHTSGLHTYINGPQHIVEMKEGKFSNYWAPMDMVAKANKHGPVGEPGSSEGHYSNTNFVLLGLIVEEVTGNSWAQEVESRIIEPLGLKDTTFLSKEGVLDIMVGGYTKMEYGTRNLLEGGYQNLLDQAWYPHPSTAWAGGDIVTTVSELMTFASALFDGKLVSRETLAVMAKPLATDEDGVRLWCLGGATIEELPGGFGMVGDIPGYNSFFVGVLDTKLVVTALCNTAEGDVIMPGLDALMMFANATADYDFPVLEEPRVYLAQEIEAILNENHGLVLRNLEVEGLLHLPYDQKVYSLVSENVIFNDGIDVSGQKGIFVFNNTNFLGPVEFYLSDFEKLYFYRCKFKDDVNFHSLESPIFRLNNSTFQGNAVFVNMRVGYLNLANVHFEKSVNFAGAVIDELNPGRLRTNDPIQILWSQFGKKWLERTLSWALAPTGEEQKSRLRQIETSLQFWKRNFLTLGYRRDALIVNYEIIKIQRKYFMKPVQVGWWASVLLGIPNGYGTNPYRPLWIGLIIIGIFAVIYWLGDPFLPQEDNPRMPKTPLLIFSLLYSMDTFIPFIHITGVKSWGWRISPNYRWTEVLERVIGLAISSLAAYSIGYHVF